MVLIGHHVLECVPAIGLSSRTRPSAWRASAGVGWGTYVYGRGTCGGPRDIARIGQDLGGTSMHDPLQCPYTYGPVRISAHAPSPKRVRKHTHTHTHLWIHVLGPSTSIIYIGA
jgi:hypothetical protein